MKKTKKIIGGLTALAVISAMCAPMSVSAETATTDVTMTKVSPYDELYTVTIPETVTVTNSGWNELKAGDVSGIKVEQTVTDPDKQFDPAKKVSISVASANSYKLKDGDNTVSYTLNAEANGEAVDKWEFSAEEVNAGTAKTVGVDVDADEYDAAPDGSYTDTLTFGISVEEVKVETLLTTITATGKEQASFSTANVATVSFSYSAEGSSAYLANWGWWGYGWTATVTPAEGYTITKCVFYDDANRTATDSEAPFVVETTEEDKTPQVNGTPMAYTSKGIKKIEVYGYAN